MHRYLHFSASALAVACLAGSALADKNGLALHRKRNHLVRRWRFRVRQGLPNA